MIKIENVKVYNFEDAFRGLRNPLNSWHLSDSSIYDNTFIIGPKDMELAQRMIAGGTDESKFLRQIFVSFDLTAPLYLLKEFDTYKVGTVANSCSTMHKIDSTPITLDMFSTDEVDLKLPVVEANDIGWLWKDVEFYCEQLRLKYKETGNKDYWRALIQLLPNGWLQKRTITLNYQVLRAMYFARRNHKLTEWRQLCNWIENLPYGLELICYEKPKKNQIEDIKNIIDLFCKYADINEPEEEDLKKFIDTLKENKNGAKRESNKINQTRKWFKKSKQ